MRWPGQGKLEARIADLEARAQSYSDALTTLIVNAQSNTATAVPHATAALEACAGFIGRSFAVAEVEAPDTIKGALTPGCMSLIGRTLMRTGDLVLLIDTSGDGLRLLPAQNWDVRGGADPMTWRYQVTVAGPDKIETTDTVPAEGVLHFRYAFDPGRAWQGYGPIGVAVLAGKLSAEVAAALADEASGPRGSFMPIPVGGNDPTVASLKGDIKGAGGAVLLAELGDWDSAGSGAATWQQQRFGASPPDGLIMLMQRATLEVYSACGLNPALFTSEGETAAREAYRQAMHSCIAPIGRMVETELTAKLEGNVSLSWAELRAGDIAGRARAFQSLVGAGMDMTAAAAASGILME